MHLGVTLFIVALSLLAGASWPMAVCRARPAALRWLTPVPPAALLLLAAGWAIGAWLEPGPVTGPWCYDLPTFEPPAERRCVDWSLVSLQAAAPLGLVVHLAATLTILNPARPIVPRWAVGACGLVALAWLVGVGQVLVADGFLSPEPQAEGWVASLLWAGGLAQVGAMAAGAMMGGIAAWRVRRAA